MFARFEVPEAIVTYNGTRFIEKRIKGLLEELRIKQYFASVENPQRNNQVEAAN